MIIETVTVPVEFFNDFRDHRIALAEWVKGKISKPHGPSWLAVLEFAGAMLVAVGVSGELLYGHRIGGIDVCMQRANSARAHILEGEASSQRLRADCTEKQLIQMWEATQPRTVDIERVAGKLRKLKPVPIGMYAALGEEPQELSTALLEAFGRAWPNTSRSGGGAGNSPIVKRPGIWLETIPYPINANPPKSAAERASRHKELEKTASRIREIFASEGLVAETRKYEAGDVSPAVMDFDSVLIFVSLRPVPSPKQIDVSKSTDANPCPIK